MPFIKWPCNSLDLNPIEAVWQLIKLHLAIRNPWPTKKATVRHATREEYENLTEDELINIVVTMPDPCLDMIWIHKGYTAYQIRSKVMFINMYSK